jgi:hypothetical protein
MDQIQWIDDCFRVEEKKWGTWCSYDKNEKCIITSLTEEECIKTTRFYLKKMQEGWNDSKTYESVVEGKL